MTDFSKSSTDFLKPSTSSSVEEAMSPPKFERPQSEVKNMIDVKSKCPVCKKQLNGHHIAGQPT